MRKARFVGLLICLFGLVGLFGVLGITPVFAQSDPIPTPEFPPNVNPDPAAGLVIYQQRCATCHGPAGLGDGPQAGQAIRPPTAIGDPAYLATADPIAMFGMIENGNLEAGMPGFGQGNNSNPLSTQDIWDVIGAIYTLPGANVVLDTAVVSGQIRHATSGDPIPNSPVILQAFTPEVAEALRLETTSDAEGNYQFDLTRIPPNWIFRTIAQYGTLEFSSDFARLSQDNPTADLPIVVYDTTSDPSVITISELDSVLDFLQSEMRVSELYVFSNESEQVFVGADGTATDVTLRFTVPPGATNVQFLRGGSSSEDYFPLNEQIVSLGENEYGLTVPIPPGFGLARILLQYVLPFERGMTLERPLRYPLEEATLIITNEGVSLAQTGAWSQLSMPEAALAENVRVYQHPPLAAGELLAYTLLGFPTAVRDPQGNQIVVRDEQQELLIGGLMLAITAVGVIFIGYRWSQQPAPASEQDTLLATLAVLDDAYAQQQISQSQYNRQRKLIKERLMAIWQG
jgi:mono/diheme cytochrome c family protein